MIGCLSARGSARSLAFFAFDSLVLAACSRLVVGASTELGRLAFQSADAAARAGWAHGRVFVRYEVLFQLAWVGGALLPAVLPIDFRRGS